MDPAAITELIKLGLPGIVIIGLTYGYLSERSKNDVIQEKRIGEARDSIKAIEQNTNALETLSEVFRDRANRT